MNRCPICLDISCRSRLDSDGFGHFDCPRCGLFVLSTRLAALLPPLTERGEVNRSALSYHMRRRWGGGDEPVRIDDEDLDALRRLRPPTPREQQENLLRWLGANQATPGQFLHSRKKPLSAIVGCHIAAQGHTESELDWLVNQMKPFGLFELHFTNQPSVVALRLTLKGWDLYYELERRTAPGPSKAEAGGEDQS
jgi:hypothetical protein